MEGRDIIRAGTEAEYNEHHDFATRHDHDAAHGPGGSTGVGQTEPGHKRTPLSLYPDAHQYPGYSWGMAIDLTTCIGCGACVVACQAENNIPVVGKEQVSRGREMHWLRIDRYFSTPAKKKARPEDLPERVIEPRVVKVHFQPLPCQHCDKAPCELVCPVEATMHGDEGTNDMVYNRCVGTRYCSNNCPYKVRRFNFLQFSDYHTPSRSMQYNPDVTVRSRGVMEKCTFCIQRIAYARIEAAKEAMDELDLPPDQRKRRDSNGPNGQPRRDQNGAEIPHIRDGEIVTACGAACPTDAIIFGDLNDRSSKVHKLHTTPLRYDLLGELGTRPRVAYLAEVRNPNPDLEVK